MTPRYLKTGAAVIWVGAVSAGGVLANVASLSGWLLIAGCALLPPFVVHRYWRGPDQTMSETIQQALR